MLAILYCAGFSFSQIVKFVKITATKKNGMKRAARNSSRKSVKPYKIHMHQVYLLRLYSLVTLQSVQSILAIFERHDVVLARHVTENKQPVTITVTSFKI